MQVYLVNYSSYKKIIKLDEINYHSSFFSKNNFFKKNVYTSENQVAVLHACIQRENKHIHIHYNSQLLLLGTPLRLKVRVHIS